MYNMYIISFIRYSCSTCLFCILEIVPTHNRFFYSSQIIAFSFIAVHGRMLHESYLGGGGSLCFCSALWRIFTYLSEILQLTILLIQIKNSIFSLPWVQGKEMNFSSCWYTYAHYIHMWGQNFIFKLWYQLL